MYSAKSLQVPWYTILGAITSPWFVGTFHFVYASQSCTCQLEAGQSLL